MLRRLSARVRVALAATTLTGGAIVANRVFAMKKDITEFNRNANLPYLSDSVFETTDNLAVFMFASEEMRSAQAPLVEQVVQQFAAKREQFDHLKPVQLMYCIVPPSTPSVLPATDVVEVVCYKGQRKLRSSIKKNENWLNAWNEFFTPRFSPVPESLKNDVIRHISGSDFADEVKQNLLVQLYEKSCFLCFLMRPFLNSVAVLLKGVAPFEFRRLDIEENDFPPGLPVVRGTPTFVMYGDSVERWTEFKPRDLVNKISQIVELPRSTRDQLFRLVDQMGLRFQAFSGLVMWTTEATKLTDLMTGETIDEKDCFNQVVSEMMIEDMSKTDALAENLTELFAELGQAEMHAIMLAQILGQKIVQMEQNNTQTA